MTAQSNHRHRVSVYKGMDSCPYCGAEITDDIVEKAAHELYAGGPWGEFVTFTDMGARAITDAHSMETYRAMVRCVLEIALDERNRP